MGGSGSGRWFRLDTPKDTVEDCVTLNIFRLTREGTLAWDKTCTGSFTAGRCSMAYQLADNQLKLQYRVKSTGRDLDYRIPLTRTYPHFGGHRLWFLCPHCNARVGKLYLAPGQVYYLCRKCADLTYQSTREMSLSDAMKILQSLTNEEVPLDRAMENMSTSQIINMLKASTRLERQTS
jgi:hypothetical protein